MAVERSHARQMIGSLIAALVIVAVTITLVTARLGVNGGIDAQRERQEQLLDLREERQEERLERREERQENRG